MSEINQMGPSGAQTQLKPDNDTKLRKRSLWITGSTIFVLAALFISLKLTGNVPKYLASFAAGTSTILSGCGEITATGSYVLGSDLVAAPNSGCINVHDATDVRLDCQGHSITIDTTTVRDIVNLVEFKNAPGYRITNCNIRNTNHRNDAAIYSIVVSGSPNGQITGNTVGPALVNIILGSNNNSVTNNTFSANLQSYDSASIVIDHNTFHLPATSNASGVIVVYNVANSRITNNTIDGASDGELVNRIGADDGIVIQKSDRALIEGNTISNIWDCGIENVQRVNSAIIRNNWIDNAGVCGVGGWYGNGWQNSLIENNTVSNAPQMFVFYRADAMYTGEDYVYFRNNQFIGNKFINPRPIVQASYINFDSLPSSIPPDRVVVGNNVFTNNDFTTLLPAPWITPAILAADGGGNICSRSTVPGFPLACSQEAGVLGIVSTLPDGTVGNSYNYQFQAAGGTPPYSWQLISTTYPTGTMTLGSDGKFSSSSKQLLQSGTFEVKIKVTDQQGATDTKLLTWNVNPALPISTIYPYIKVTSSGVTPSLREIEAYNLSGVKITALSATATSSLKTNPASYVIDGNNSTKWVSQKAGASIVINLGKGGTVSKIRLLNGTAVLPGSQYTIWGSSNGVNYTALKVIKGPLSDEVWLQWP